MKPIYSYKESIELANKHFAEMQVGNLTFWIARESARKVAGEMIDFIYREMQLNPSPEAKRLHQGLVEIARIYAYD